MSNVLVIVGPTCVGKSALAIALSRRCSGEIISADSRQVYRFLDIGTAKPSVAERNLSKHHLVDIVDPDIEYSLATFLRDAREAIKNVEQINHLPIVVGGSGQYVRALIEGWQVPRVPPDIKFRRALEERARQNPGLLYSELVDVNPEAAGRIDPRNTRRVIRALEIHYLTDSLCSRTLKPQHNFKIVGLTLRRKDLYLRIDERVDDMMSIGFLDEVKKLLEMGFSDNLPSMSSLGYRELARHLKGELSLDEAVNRIKFKTHRFVRQQYAWFKLSDPRIQWFDVSAGRTSVEIKAYEWLKSLSVLSTPL